VTPPTSFHEGRFNCPDIHLTLPFFPPPPPPVVPPRSSGFLALGHFRGCFVFFPVVFFSFFCRFPLLVWPNLVLVFRSFQVKTFFFLDLRTFPIILNPPIVIQVFSLPPPKVPFVVSFIIILPSVVSRDQSTMLSPFFFTLLALSGPPVILFFFYPPVGKLFPAVPWFPTFV